MTLKLTYAFKLYGREGSADQEHIYMPAFTLTWSQWEDLVKKMAKAKAEIDAVNTKGKKKK